jgi:hypothetical protein
VEVGPGLTEIVLIKASRGADFAPGPVSRNVMLGDSSLKQLAISKDFRISRVGEEIFLYKTWHENGFVTYYVNDSKDKVLTEVVEYDLKGMEIEGLPNERNVKIKIGPGESQLVKLVNTSGDRELKSNIVSKKVTQLKEKKISINSDFPQ